MDEARTQIQVMGYLFNKKLNGNNNKNYPVGGKQDSWQARQGRTGQGTTRQGRNRIHSGRNDDELAQDCKHKEIIKGANEEGNKGEQLGKMNQ